MKKLILYISFLIGGVGAVKAQIRPNTKEPIIACDIIDTNVKREVQQYIKRHLGNENEKGVVIVKLPNLEYDKANYDFYISEILETREFKPITRVAISMVNGHWVLLFGLWNAHAYIKNGNKVTTSIVEKSLINSDIKKFDQYGNQTYIIFDPEVVKFTVKENLIVLKKQLSGLDLNAKF